MDFDPVIDSAPGCHAFDLATSSVRSRLVRWRQVARANVAGLPVQGSAAAQGAEAQAQGLACAG